MQVLRFTIFRGREVLKNPPTNARDARDKGLLPGSERSLGVGNGNLLQYSCLGNPMDRGALWATFHGVTEIQPCMQMQILEIQAVS